MIFIVFIMLTAKCCSRVTGNCKRACEQVSILLYTYSYTKQFERFILYINIWTIKTYITTGQTTKRDTRHADDTGRTILLLPQCTHIRALYKQIYKYIYIYIRVCIHNIKQMFSFVYTLRHAYSCIIQYVMYQNVQILCIIYLVHDVR